MSNSSVTSRAAQSKHADTVRSKKSESFRYVFGGDFTPFDLFAILFILVGGLAYYWNVRFWSIGFIGDNQWGDAEFWLNGAIHFAKGIIEDNPASGFRPGYMVLTGSAMALLGISFSKFYTFFLVAYLSCMAFFYVSTREMLGRIGALAAVVLIVFSPFQAEWAATATTDATGLALHILALSFLLRSAGANFSIRPLLAFGFLFSCAELTRPLMSPFVGLVVLVLMLFAKSPLKQRLLHSAKLILAFAIPLIAWSGFQMATVGEFSVSQNDTSAYYAASDPKIQSWNPEMQESVLRSAQARLHRSDVSVVELYAEYRRQTIENYLNPRNWKYHLRRLLSNFWSVANHSVVVLCQHPKSENQSGMFAFFLVLISLERFLSRRKWEGLFALALAGITVVSWGRFGWLIIPALIVAIIGGVSRKREMAPVLVALYWLTGQFCLYVVGGTSGDPKHLESCSVNALGQRLSTQFYFCVAVLTVYVAIRLLYWQKGVYVAQLRGLRTWISRPSATASRVIVTGFLICATSFFIVETCGAVIAIDRYKARQSSPVVRFPALHFKEHPTSKTLRPCDEVGFPETRAVNADFPEVLVTGAMSSFIWNMPGQKRCLAFLYRQDKIRPFSMYPNRIIVEFPKHLNSEEWTYRQGAWLLRRTADLKPLSHEPYYWSGASVRKFIPLTTDESGFDLAHAVDFPIAKYASQLAASGELQFDRASVEWSPNSVHERMRMFTLKSTGGDTATLRLDLRTSSGKRQLTFVVGGTSEAELKRVQSLICEVVFNRANEPPSVIRKSVARPQATLNFDLKDASILDVEIRIRGLQNDGVAISEMVLLADRFSEHPHEAEQSTASTAGKR